MFGHGRKCIIAVLVLPLLLVMSSCDEDPQPLDPQSPSAEKTVFVEIDKGVITEMKVPTSLDKVTTTSYPPLTGVKIAYDMTHNTGRQGAGAPTNVTNFYTSFQNDLTGRGATITEIYTFDMATLNLYDILWIEEDWNSVLSAAEMTLLQSWVTAGGKVFISGDEWSSPQPFSVFGYSYTGGTTFGTTNVINAHPATMGVSSIALAGCQAGVNSPVGAYPLVMDVNNSYAYASVYPVGCGMVVVVTDELFINSVINSQDNRVLGNNLFTFMWIQEIAIDIKPGGYPNSINCGNMNGVVPVAILSTTVFDATALDHTTVTFEGASETHIDKKTSIPVRHVDDVNSDGLMDLVFHFRFGDTNLDCNSTVGYLYVQDACGNNYYGMDSVNMVP